MRKCKWCLEKISERATVCPHCQLPQSKLLRKLSILEVSGALTISFLSPIISGAALWFSTRDPKIAPEVDAQIIAYSTDHLQFLAYNFGKAPTIVTSLNLEISLAQLDTTHRLNLYFPIKEPALLPSGGSKIFKIPYSSFSPNWSKWERTGGNDIFDLGFLNVAAQMGSNLECNLELRFSSVEHNSYRAIRSSQSNGNCVEAMERYSKKINPLQTSINNDVSQPSPKNTKTLVPKSTNSR